MDNTAKKKSAAVLSVISNTSLVIFKLIVGIMISSVSVISEAIHSGVDLLAAIIAYFAVKTASKEADDEHPFGHGKAENISGTIEALLIFIAAIWIIIEAIKKLIHPEPLESMGWGIAVMLISTVMNLYVSSKLFKVGEETDSIALKADGWHLRTDVYTSAGVMVGLIIMTIAEKINPNLHIHWIDPLAAIAVAVLILKAAYSLTVESARDLMDVSLPEDEELWIRNYLSANSDKICGFHHLRTRKAGSYRFINVHILVEADMSVEKSHNISDAFTKDIKDHFPGTNVQIHIEPCNHTCTDNCISGCLMGEEYREMKYQKLNIKKENTDT